MKRLVWTLCLTMGLTESLSALSTADYVQEGLVTHFDAIENAGKGKPHDNALATWVDLKGNASIAKKASAAWLDNAFDSSPTEHLINNMPNYDRMSMTLEVTVNIQSNGKASASTQWPRIFANWEHFSIHFENAGKQPRLFMKGNPDGELRLYGTDFRKGTIGTSSGPDYVALLINGAEDRTRPQMPEMALTDGTAAGWKLNGYSGWLHGHYHALRFYNRQLTPDEAKRNAVIDSIRFWNTYPTGYRQNGDTLQQRAHVAAPTGGTVTVDGTPLAANFESWTAFGTSVTHTLTATPADGYFFIGWTGDTSCITSGTTYSRTITVSRALALSLTPNFKAIPTPARAEPVVTIDVPSGTAYLDDWLAANPSVSLDAARTIVKTGNGELVVTNDLIATFRGDLIIETGRWHARSRTGLGHRTSTDTTDGAVWVENGATLHVWYPNAMGDNSTAKDKYQILRRVYLIGTGTNGKGALFGSTNVGKDTEVYYGFPKNISLLGDAKIGCSDHMNFYDLVVDLNGFTATVAPYDSDWVRLSGNWRNGGIVAEENPIILLNPSTLNGDANNTIRFNSKSGCRATSYATTAMENANNGTWSREGRWTAIFDSGATFYGPNAAGGGLGWNGPIILNGNTKITAQDPWKDIWLRGPISGAGNLGYLTAAANTKFVKLTLENRHNTFTGGIWLKRNVLTATKNGAIPANGGAVTMYDSSLNLSGVEAYALPDLVITGTGSVFSAANTTGAFKNVSKADDTLFTWNTKVGAASFALNGGTLAFGALSVSSGKIAVDLGRFSAAKGAQLDLAGNAWTCTNLTGAATLLNGTLTVNGPWTLDAEMAGTLGGETGAVTFGEKAELILDNLSGLDRSIRYTLASSSVPFTAVPPVHALSDDRWQVRLSSDGRRLELSYSKGTTVLVR